MKCQWLINWRVSLVVLFNLSIGVSGAEKLDRGFVALEKEDGSVFLSWRLLADDAPDMAFTVMRDSVNLTKGKPYRQTCFIDTEQEARRGAGYTLYRFSEGGEVKQSDRLGLATAIGKSYLSIPLKGGYDFQKVGIGDLDGDGAYEYLIKQPNFNTDPYQQPGYWKKSTTTYKIEAYRLDGTMMWRYDMGWSIEAGIWYSPWIVYDVDGDGKAEVYCKAGEGDPRDEKGLVQSGSEYLVKIDGQTGQVVAKTAWLTRDEFPSYNYYCRNFLTVAYLDGKTPSLIMQRGTYNIIKTQALDRDFSQLWYW